MMLLRNSGLQRTVHQCGGEMKNLKIGTRLTLGFMLITIFMIVVSAISIVRMGGLNDDTKLIVEDRAPKVLWVHSYIVSLNRQARSFRNILLFKDTKAIDREQERISAERKNAGEMFAKLESTITSEKGKLLLGSIADHRDKFGELIKRYDTLVDQNEKEAAFDLLMTEVRPEQLAYMDSLNKLIDYQTELMHASGDEADATYKNARMIMIALTIAAIILALGVTVYITTSITRPMGEAVKIAQTVAKGDLTSRIDVTSRDETGQLIQALKEMNESLIRIVGNVRSSTDTIATASAQIAAGNVDLSSRTEEQASSLEETASSMEELTSTVRQNAENASQANQLAVTASDVAVKGGEVVSQVVETMSAINESSKKMADIINVIDGIAFQTNILALNAAVEAARAGEQGRGFAVVATEVRNLAQRSASAAREIKMLIDDSVGKVDQGSKLVEQAGSTMTEVVTSIKHVHSIMAEITEASREQSDGIEQVNQAVVQMDEVTQQNAALVEEAAAAAQSLQDQARNLVNVVSVFNTGQATSSSAAIANTPAPKKQTKTPLPVPQAQTSKTPQPASSATVAQLPRSARQASSAPTSDDWEEF